jgi:hypothetical protein
VGSPLRRRAEPRSRRAARGGLISHFVKALIWPRLRSLSYSGHAAADKSELVTQICNALKIHTEIEEEAGEMFPKAKEAKIDSETPSHCKKCGGQRESA